MRPIRDGRMLRGARTTGYGWAVGASDTDEKVRPTSQAQAGAAQQPAIPRSSLCRKEVSVSRWPSHIGLMLLDMRQTSSAGGNSLRSNPHPTGLAPIRADSTTDKDLLQRLFAALASRACDDKRFQPAARSLSSSRLGSQQFPVGARRKARRGVGEGRSCMKGVERWPRLAKKR